ncbi:phosphopantetheine-binding protein [Micromonospora sp. NPDC049559]|uniref:phosphopantetheine-binding protein n=1 Tax=Micromonospora sp. NPDC049559 TaxID=3155923 RepID=UPI0034437EF8
MSDSSLDPTVDPAAEPVVDPEVLAHVREIWSEVLGVACPPDGTFFALGGHSLAAFWIVARVEQDYGVSVDPAGLFEDPDVRRFAAQVAERLRARPAGGSGATPGPDA